MFGNLVQQALAVLTQCRTIPGLTDEQRHPLLEALPDGHSRGKKSLTRIDQIRNARRWKRR